MPNRMFQSVTRTWNPVIGCEHDCIYCWARDTALGRLKHTRKYRDGFSPRLYPFLRIPPFKNDDFVFVCSMVDLFGKWVPDEWIHWVPEVIHRYPGTRFLLQTKNPERFHQFAIPLNAYVGTTIETDLIFNVSKAPPPRERYEQMLLIPPYIRKFLSIEPIMDFTLDGLTRWVSVMRPDIIEIGADNHHKHLPEPPGDKVLALIKNLRIAGLNVIEKPGLERLWRDK